MFLRQTSPNLQYTCTTLAMKLLWQRDGSMHIRNGHIALINNVLTQLGPS